MNTPTPEFQLQFLDYLQRIFAEGEFTATYKFALLIALADLAVEKGDDSVKELELTSRDIARKFIGYYDRQTRPYPYTDKPRILHQNTGRQARIVTIVSELDESYTYAGKSVAPRSITKVAQTVRVQPLWKLQTLGRSTHDFLYPNLMKGDTIRLRPGVAYCFRRFHGFVLGLAQSRWIAFIRQQKHNREILGEAVDLGEFLFGSERADLKDYRSILTDIQSRQCFYCGKNLKESEVDHFVPWALYSTDLGHNFVLSCPGCNNAKRDMLADIDHLERWTRRNEDHGSALNTYFDEKLLAHDLQGTMMITKWAYQQTQNAGNSVWHLGKDRRDLGSGWRDCFPRS
jgi:HNH endonuclease